VFSLLEFVLVALTFCAIVWVNILVDQ